MPVIDFDNDIHGAGIALLGIMTWPSDHRRQREWVASMAAKALRDLQESPWPNRDMEAGAIMEHLFKPAGGLGTLLATKGGDHAVVDEFCRAANNGALLSGHVLVVLACMSLHHPTLRPSRNLAFAIVRAYYLTGRGHRKPIGLDRKGLGDHWEEWHPVAHLWAAMFWMQFRMRQFDVEIPLAIGQDSRHCILSWAGWFRRFAIEFRAQGKAIVSEDVMLDLRTDVEPTQPGLLPLNQASIEVARDFRKK